MAAEYRHNPKGRKEKKERVAIEIMKNRIIVYGSRLSYNASAGR